MQKNIKESLERFFHHFYNSQILNTLKMTIDIRDYKTEQRVEKVIKQLPYSQSKQNFVLTALNLYIDQLWKGKIINQRI